MALARAYAPDAARTASATTPWTIGYPRGQVAGAGRAPSNGPSAAAERMWRSRERRRAGSFCYLIELPGPLIDRLAKLGLLAAVARNDKAAVLNAFRQFVQQALGFSRSGGSE